MIDLHCHILPGLDDGPETLQESLAMCRVALEDGIRVVVAMPHTLNGVYYNDGETVLEALDELREALGRERLTLTVLPGSDVRVDPGLLSMVRDGRIMSIAQTGRSVMLEFPDYFVPERMCRFVESLAGEGVLPVISHPERCTQFQDTGLVRRMVDLGAVTQVTAMSLTGEFGQTVQARGRALLEEGLAHVIASDAHSAHRRPPILSRAVAEAAQVVGEEGARALVLDNPSAIIEGRHP